MINSTHDNFKSSTLSDSEPWAANSKVTFGSFLGQSDTHNSVRVNSCGSWRIINKRPLIAN